MPSWNIHTAHVERLLAEEEPSALGIRDANAFLFGNLVPDIYVGWMVPQASRKINYLRTHFADVGDIPTPRYGEFFERYVAPSAGMDGRVSDVVLGAWCHLVADHVYNHRFSQLIKRIGVEVSPRTRERKQADFDIFGRTLSISQVPEPTDALVAQAASFPQYPIAEADVRATCDVMAQIVRNNAVHHVSDPVYDLVSEDFFSRVPAELDALLREALHEYAAGRPNWGRRR